MAVEERRNCGYRKVGGIYLVGGGMGAACDRLPKLITPCPVCGECLRFSRGIAAFNPQRRWGKHELCSEGLAGVAPRDCPMCDPPERGWLMWVGTEYTPAEFLAEAHRLGISKRIPAVPDDFRIGADWVYLAYWRYPLLKDAVTAPAIFTAFRPARIEKIITQSQADRGDGERLRLREHGITPVVVPDEDPDHARGTWGRTPVVVPGGDDPDDDPGDDL